MFQTIYSQLVLAAAVLVITFVFWKGDESERMGGAAYAMVFVATTMITENSAHNNIPRWGVMGIESVLLVVFIGIAWQSRRAWPVWAASFQALIVTCHALVATNLRPTSNAVAAVINMSNYGLLVALAIGAFWAWQERRALEQMKPDAGPGSHQ